MLIRVAMALLLACRLAQACTMVPSEQQYALIDGQLAYHGTLLVNPPGTPPVLRPR